ncbi:DUF349 domain-containing protein [Cytophagaceae bacterium DM2B3-1]|uniref:DUF349 domain-containing protein n=1 Tax=Xanthocytophaga flava TaxID=3048013 RepID=A0ABT7CL22_9BACT|nr:DUF349 domain-containing protein [Xanthocytophaga flavus]MDJ1493670.1 DUF349 domain-containing protein [Xanthocytophaga flavus]
MNTEQINAENEELDKSQSETLEAEHEHVEEHHIDYASFTKKDFVKLAEDALAGQDQKQIDEVMRHAKPVFDEMKEVEKNLALEKFIASGGDKEDFEYKYDGLTVRFENLCRQLKEKKVKWIQDQERSKEQNLQAKAALLERLRQLVDSEESNASVAELKKIQAEWKTTGPVPQAQGQELWANFNALVERFYSNRSIYFELKELDRKKNLELKADICEKAEKLAQQDASSAVVKELNELHEEFKHVGPVPREEQDAIWQRFKAASDVVYNKRKEQMESVRLQMEQHVSAKLALCTEVEPYAAFQSDKISDWNDKTKEILEIQKRWDAIGLLPREKAKEINKRFWAAFKQFFHHKNEFFRHLEAAREENLKIKTSLCEQVEALKDNDDFEATADKIKELQQRWKEVGPVSEKFRDAIFERFKQACDAFFERRRGQRNQTEREFEKNLEVKLNICAQIEKLAEEKSTDVAAFEALREQYEAAGFVPRKNMDSIRKRYSEAVKKFLENTQGLSDTERAKAILTSELKISKNNPHAARDLQRKEQAMRRKITQLENDIALWKNNLEFFANSKNADAFRKDFTSKIEAAEKELSDLKQQIKLFYDL